MFRATPTFAVDEYASDLSDTSSVDSGNSDTPKAGYDEGMPDLTPGVFQCELCVPYATVFFSQEAVTVKYNINVCFEGRRWSIDKRFSELLILHKAIKDLHTKEQSIGAKVSQAIRGGTKENPLFPTFPSRRIFSGNTNQSIKAVLSRRVELNTYFQVISNPDYGFLCSKELNAKLFRFISCPMESSASPRSAVLNGSRPGGSGGWGAAEFDIIERNDFVNIVEKEHVNAFFRVPEKHRLCTNIEWIKAALPNNNGSTAPRKGSTTVSPSSSLSELPLPSTPSSSRYYDPNVSQLSTTGSSQRTHSICDSSTGLTVCNSPSDGIDCVLSSRSTGDCAETSGQQPKRGVSPPQSSGLSRRRGSSLWKRELSTSSSTSSLMMANRQTSGGALVVEPTKDIIEQMGAIPTLVFGLPNAKLCFNDNDPLQMLVVLRCKKFESRVSVKHRNDELLAFYGFVVQRGSDAIPDLTTTKNFFRRYQELNPLQNSSVLSSVNSTTSSISREGVPRGRSSLNSILNGWGAKSSDSDAGSVSNGSLGLDSASGLRVVSLADLARGASGGSSLQGDLEGRGSRTNSMRPDVEEDNDSRQFRVPQQQTSSRCTNSKHMHTGTGPTVFDGENEDDDPCVSVPDCQCTDTMFCSTHEGTRFETLCGTAIVIHGPPNKGHRPIGNETPPPPATLDVSHFGETKKKGSRRH